MWGIVLRRNFDDRDGKKSLSPPFPLFSYYKAISQTLEMFLLLKREPGTGKIMMAYAVAKKGAHGLKAGRS